MQYLSNAVVSGKLPLSFCSEATDIYKLLISYLVTFSATIAVDTHRLSTVNPHSANQSTEHHVNVWPQKLWLPRIVRESNKTCVLLCNNHKAADSAQPRKCKNFTQTYPHLLKSKMVWWHFGLVVLNQQPCDNYIYSTRELVWIHGVQGASFYVVTCYTWASEIYFAYRQLRLLNQQSLNCHQTFSSSEGGVWARN